ncbi:hypothetical protein EsH8_XI_000077 [Colletotrichum jinshuiense]
MTFGILEAIRADGSLVPGTVLLRHDAQNASDSGGATISAPRQFDSTTSPLTLSTARKEMYFFTLVFGACVTGATGPLIVPAFSLVAAEFDTTLQHVTMLNGVLVMALGVSSYVLAAFAEIIGRRLVFLGTSALLVIACTWAAVSNSYGALLGARVLQGLAMASFFALGGTMSINDVFPIHERGRRAGLWNFAVMFANNITPIISGYLIVALSWRWAFWILAISSGACFVLVWLFYPETKVDPSYNYGGQNGIRQGGSTSDIETPVTKPKDGRPVEGNLNTLQGASDKEVNHNPVETQSTWTTEKVPPFWKKVMRVENLCFGSFSDLGPGLFGSLALLGHPAVIWSCVMWSIIFTWVIVLGAVADQIFAAPPYNLSPSDVGILIGVYPLVGSVVGTIFAGWAADLAATFLSSRNYGLYEPEFRLLVMLPSVIGFAVGAFGLGIAIRDGLSTAICGAFLAFISFGVGTGCTCIVSYTNDVCMEKSGNVFGLAMGNQANAVGKLTKSAFAFGLTFMLNNYYASNGPVIFFSTWGGLSVAGCVATIPMYVFGKRIRAFWGRM